MNTYQIHAEYVFHHPDEKTPALALVDRDMEEGVGDFLTCLRGVAAMRVAARRAKRLTQATRYLAKRAKHRGSLASYIRRNVPHLTPGNAVIYVVEGHRPPEAMMPLSHSADGSPYVHTILVGASWVVRAAKLLAHLRRCDNLLAAAGFRPRRRS